MNKYDDPIFRELFAGLDSAASPPLQSYIALIDAQTRADVKRAEEGVAFKDRVVAVIDSVRPVKLGGA